MQNNIFGYFEGNDSKPTYDPGLNVPCIFCWKPLVEKKKTISLMKMNDTRSYFYRCCKSCYESRTPEEINLYESSLIDNLDMPCCDGKKLCDACFDKKLGDAFCTPFNENK